MENYYVYRHRRLDTFGIFYVGIGKGYRCNNKFSRNNYWKNIVNKHGYVVEILYKNLDKETACELEVLLISEYGRKDLDKGLLCNRTDGGDGNIGLIVSKETRLKQRLQKLGKTHSQETINRRKESLSKLINWKSKKVIDIDTGIIYDSIKKASDELGISYTLLRGRILNDRMIKGINIKYYGECEIDSSECKD